MPGTTTTVGGLTLPVEAEGTGTAIADPTVDLLLSFVAHCLKADLDTKLSGDLPGTSGDACPTGNRYAYDPTDPRAQHVTYRPPALFVWWNGESERDEVSTVYEYRRRNIDILYLFPELPARAELELRRGLMAAVDACLFKSFRDRQHPTFSYNGSAPNARIERTIADRDRLGITFLGGSKTRIGIDDPNRRNTVSKRSGRDWPAYAAAVQVMERVDWYDAEFHNAGATATRYHRGFDVQQRHVPQPIPKLPDPP